MNCAGRKRVINVDINYTPTQTVNLCMLSFTSCGSQITSGSSQDGSTASTEANYRPPSEAPPALCVPPLPAALGHHDVDCRDDTLRMLPIVIPILTTRLSYDASSYGK